MNTRRPTIAVVTIGQSTIGFEDHAAAFDMMRLLGQGVQLDSYLYSIRDYLPDGTEYVLQDNGSLPSLKFVLATNINPLETREEVEIRGKREKQDREDLEQEMRRSEILPELPAPEAAPRDPFDPFDPGMASE